MNSSASLGSSFSSLSIYDLTIQGGWDPATGSTLDQTVFANTYVQVGSLTNPWIGSLTINNISVLGSNQDGINIFASNVALTNVNTSYSAMNGISITASNAGSVVLNNVTAISNGQTGGSEPVGSGVSINGADTLVSVIGGSFVNNARYGIEASNSTSTSLPTANLWTDQDDYSPGSVVTLSGNDNSLNGDNVGFTLGETVRWLCRDQMDTLPRVKGRRLLWGMVLSDYIVGKPACNWQLHVYSYRSNLRCIGVR